MSTHNAEYVRVIADALWAEPERWSHPDGRPIPLRAAEVAVEALEAAHYRIVCAFRLAELEMNEEGWPQAVLSDCCGAEVLHQSMTGAPYCSACRREAHLDEGGA